MKLSRQTYTWFTRTLVLLPAAVIGCAGDPPEADNSRTNEEGRVKLGESSLANRNFDARETHNARVRFADSRVTPTLVGRFAASDIAATFDETTGVTRTLSSTNGFLTGPAAGGPEAVAVDFAHANLDLLGLTKADLADMEVFSSIPADVSGTAHVHYRQRHLGLPVYSGQLQFNVQKDGRILSINNAFVPGLADLAKSTSPAISADVAVASAAANIGVDLSSQPRILTAALVSAERKTQVDATGLSVGPVDAKLMWLAVNAKHVALVWNFQIETLDSNHWFDFTVDAETGKVWTRFDWVASDSYRAYKEPVESPNFSTPVQPADGRVLVPNPANAVASRNGWHNATAPFIHSGNNVHAYDDRDANNAPPATQPTCTTARDCDFPLDLTLAPSTYTSAAVSNLFYWNNLIHDVTYHYGFNEASRNFQVNNFGLGGLGNDAVRAEAQDAGGTNNANFATPSDGSPPRMQMFEWTQTTPRRDGDFDNGVIVHEYGHGISNRLVGGGNVSCLTNSQQGGEGWSDWFGLWFSARATDVGTTGRGIGTYVLGQPTTGPGIRTQRYSTDPAINTWTYASIAGMAIPHGVGSVWAQVLWEMYWSLVNQWGYSPNLFDANGNAGNQRAMLYVIQGLKNTICQPNFVNARDGIIAAATATHGGEDVCRLWSVFAAYGLGTNAVPTPLTSPTNGFNVPASCQQCPPPIANAGPDRSICAGASVTIGTPAVAGTTYSWSPGGATTAQITVTPAVTTTYTVTATNACGTASDSVTVTVSPSGGGGGFLDEFETGATGWTTTGLWHLVNNSACASPGHSSPTRAFYYGQDATCNYNTGATNTGTLTSPPISGITASSVFTFDYRRTVESFSGTFDRTFVDVIGPTGAVTTVFNLSSANPSTNVWTASPNISLAAFAGQTIRLRFTFNTVDSVSNAFLGWFIDDVQVTGAPACPLQGQPQQAFGSALTAPVSLLEPQQSRR